MKQQNISSPLLPRVELKYVIPIFLKEKISRELSPFLELDSNSVDPELGYKIHSLYYDSDSFICYRRKVDGEARRAKLRLRRYEYMEQNQCFLEIKINQENRIIKKRTFLPLDELMKSLRPLNPLKPSHLAHDEVFQNALYLVRFYRLKPKIVINYSRLAFVGRFHPWLRVTFDTAIRSQREELSPESKIKGIYELPPHLCVLEVKYNGELPRFVEKILKKYNCRLQRLSKYCQGIETVMSAR